MSMKNPNWSWLDNFPFTLKCYFRCFIGHIINIKYRHILSRNKSFYNKYYNQEVIIIANGPSLLQIDRKVFSNRKVIVMNNFDQCEWKDELNIVAHCVGEPFDSISFFDHSVFFLTHAFLSSHL